MSATNTGWRLILLAATSPSLTVESNPITLELVSPGPQGPSGSAAAVTSVNGETGAVVLDAADVGAAPAVHTHAIADVTGLQDALNAGTNSLTKTARNDTASTITKGQVVYIYGSSGDNLLVRLADADIESTAASTIGVATANIAAGADGTILVAGYLENLSNLPVASFANGAALWLSQTAGGWTTTPPTQPAHRVFLGWVITNSNGNAGRAYIKVINGQELDELHDVLIASKAEKDLLSYDATAGLWKNRTRADAGVASSVHAHAIADVTGLQTALDGKAATSHVHAIGDVTGLQTALDGKAATSHTHGVGDVTGLGTAATRNAPAAGNAASSEVVLGNDSRLSDSRTPTGAAGGGLTGNYPNPSLVAPGANGRVFWHSNGGFGNSSFFVWDNTTSTMTLSNALAESVSFSPSGITANGPFTIADTAGANSTAFTLDDAAETATFANFLAVDMTGADLTARRLSLKNGEYLENEIDGDVHLMPAPGNSNFVGLRFQFNWAFDTVRIGTKRSSTGTNDDGRIQWLVPLQVFDNTNFILGDSSRSAIRQARGSSRPQTLQIGVNAVDISGVENDSNHALVLCNIAHLGNAARMPSTLYLDPSFLVYSADVAQPNDFVRLTHDQTDGLLESGNGDLRLVAPGEVRFNGNLIQKRITYGTVAPTGGVDGDIYIQYT